MMTKRFERTLGVLVAGALVATAGCSSLPGPSEASQEKEGSGPSVLFARSEPGTVELNRDLQPLKPAEIIADVRDAGAKVAEVKLQFTHIPLEVQMENIGGNTWRAELSPRQLEILAVSGRTIKYDANVIAKDTEGKTAMTKKPVEVSVKAPNLSAASTGYG